MFLVQQTGEVKVSLAAVFKVFTAYFVLPLQIVIGSTFV